MVEAMGVAGRDENRSYGGSAGESANAARTRVRRQRETFRRLEDGAAKEDFRRAVLARAEELLPINPEAADALLEFLPKEDRESLLTGFFER